MLNKHDPPLVLIADDEVNTTIMLERIFEREGYQVECTNDGVTALEIARQRAPDLILLDIMMPKMDGFDVLRMLREDKLTARIPTILITAKAREPADVARGLDLGADDYMYKPFAPQELVARAHSKMRARQLEDALQRRTQDLTALLRVSEELNQHFEVASDLRHLILNLALDLLPGQFVALYLYDEQGVMNEYQQYRHQSAHTNGNTPALDQAQVLQLAQTSGALLWTEENPAPFSTPYGIMIPLQHSQHLLGAIVLLDSDNLFDENHLILCKGFGRQVALALRNAQLYAIQKDYALHLEDMVAARTAELQSAQQMLIRSEKLASIGHLAANIAHEINNPLQPITLTLEDIVESVHSGQPVDIRGVEIIQESVDRIRRIVSQLLEFTGKRNTGAPDVRDLDIGEILERIAVLNRKFFEKQRNVLVLDTRENLPRIHGSKDQLEQVFMNLALNAQAAMQPGGKLTIQSYPDGEHLIIKFIDEGSGIAPEIMDKIFDPFFSTKPNGTGLGLFVTYGIIQGHQGSIDVDSAVGQGTTFTIRLPIQNVQPTQ
jgi:signal transduction histidine kinase/DNA-binding NarL/FixJ family response regulator